MVLYWFKCECCGEKYKLPDPPKEIYKCKKCGGEGEIGVHCRFTEEKTIIYYDSGSRDKTNKEKQHTSPFISI